MEEWNHSMSEMVIYQCDNGDVNIEVRIDADSVWLSQAQMSILFHKAKSTISEHIKAVFIDQELDKNAVVRNYRTTAIDGKNYNVEHYNLEMIIAVGFLVRSKTGTLFRQWANEILTSYLVKGNRFF